MDVPLAVCDVARFGRAGEQLLQASALERERGCDAGEVVEGRGEVERGNRLGDDASGGDTRPAGNERDAQQVLVRNRVLQVQPVVAEELAVVSGKDDERVPLETEIG